MKDRRLYELDDAFLLWKKLKDFLRVVPMNYKKQLYPVINKFNTNIYDKLRLVEANDWIDYRKTRILSGSGKSYNNNPAFASAIMVWLPSQNWDIYASPTFDEFLDFYGIEII